MSLQSRAIYSFFFPPLPLFFLAIILLLDDALHRDWDSVHGKGQSQMKKAYSKHSCRFFVPWLNRSPSFLCVPRYGLLLPLGGRFLEFHTHGLAANILRNNSSMQISTDLLFSFSGIKGLFFPPVQNTPLTLIPVIMYHELIVWIRSRQAALFFYTAQDESKVRLGTPPEPLTVH